MANAPKLATLSEAGAKGGRGKKAVDNIKGFTGGGTSKSYLASRLKRDHPDVAKRVEAGEFRSIRAAAVAAGIVRVKTPLDELNYWWGKASDEERRVFMESRRNDMAWTSRAG